MIPGSRAPGRTPGAWLDPSRGRRATLRGLALTAFVLVAAPPRPAAPQETPTDTTGDTTIHPVATVATRAAPALILVRGLADQHEVARGTGFLLHDGTLVTSRRLIQDARRLELRIHGGEIFRDVWFVADSPERDLALLRLPATHLPGLAVGTAPALAPGDTVYVSAGALHPDSAAPDDDPDVVAGRLRDRPVIDGVRYLRIDLGSTPRAADAPPATRHPPDPGSPVLDPAGDVVGVVRRGGAGGNPVLAIPIGYVEGLLALADPPRPFHEVAAQRLIPPGDVPVWQRSVRTRLEQIADLIADQGFIPTDVRSEGMLAPETYDAFQATLQPGTYKVVGVCDDDCADLDLVVITSQDDLVGRDILTDAFPIVDFTVDTPTDYRLAVHMVRCSTRLCYYAALLFRQR